MSDERWIIQKREGPFTDLLWDVEPDGRQHLVAEIHNRDGWDAYLSAATERIGALEAALGKAAYRGLMIYHIANGHVGPAAFCEMTGCKFERRDMDKIAAPFLAAAATPAAEARGETECSCGLEGNSPTQHGAFCKRYGRLREQGGSS